MKLNFSICVRMFIYICIYFNIQYHLIFRNSFSIFLKNPKRYKYILRHQLASTFTYILRTSCYQICNKFMT